MFCVFQAFIVLLLELVSDASTSLVFLLPFWLAMHILAFCILQIIYRLIVEVHLYYILVLDLIHTLNQKFKREFMPTHHLKSLAIFT